MIETGWAQSLFEELEDDNTHKLAADGLINVLSNLSGMALVKPAVASELATEIGDPVPDTEAPLGDFSPSIGSSM